MDPKDIKDNGQTPLPDSLNDFPKSNTDDYNPYRDEVEDEKKENTNIEKEDNRPVGELFNIDPDKGNISEQLGMQFDYPTESHFKNDDQSHTFNEPQNLQITDDVPQSMEDFNNFEIDNNRKETYNYNDNLKEPINNKYSYYFFLNLLIKIKTLNYIL